MPDWSWLTALKEFALSKLLPAVLIAAVGIVAVRLVMNLLDKAFAKSKLEKVASGFIKSVLRVVLYVLLVLAALSHLGVDVTGVIALASVLTLAVSLALQNALSNLIGGFTLLYTKPFHSGDFVEIAGQSGTVEEIGMTYTRLSTADRKSIAIPNSTVTASQITNYTALGTRRVDITVSAAYDAPVETVLDALRESAAVPTALAEPAPSAVLKSYDESVITYTLFVWSSAADYWTTLYDVNKRVKEVFDAKGIAMSYPHLNVHLDRGAQ